MNLSPFSIDRRILSKTILWRILATLITFTVSLLVTGRIDIAGSIGVLDAAIKTLVYYYHEKFWDRRS
jgi:uncharacterized membrane protein